MYFSEKFKELRKSNDLTQEQVADIFHVSPKCVSRWENGANYPDVQMLPHIAIFFKVTVDELLGTEEIRGERKAGEYGRDIRNLLNSGKVDAAIDLARKATQEYPLNSELHYLFSQALSASDINKHKDEIIKISERIINLTDYKSSMGNRVQLIRYYAGWGMKEEAQKLLDTLPADIWDAKEVWQGLILDGDKWLKNQQWRIIRGKYLLEYFIREYIDKADLDAVRKLECRKAKVQIERLIDVISGQESEPIEFALEQIDIAESYCEVGDTENALDYLEKATRDSMHHIEQMDKTNESDGGNYMAWSTPRNLPWILWEDHLSKPVFDLVRSDARFVKCFDELKANSRELK